MAKKIDNASQRLGRLFAASKRSNKLKEHTAKLFEEAEGIFKQQGLAGFDDQTGGEPSRPEFSPLRDVAAAGSGEPASWKHSVLRDAAASSVLTLDPDSKFDKPLAAAFAAAGLDPGNPFSWRLLLTFFALAHYGSKGRGRGRPLEWTGDRYCRLLRDWRKLQIESPRLNAKALGDKLAKRGAYMTKDGKKSLSGGRLKKAVSEARNPTHNDVFGIFLSRSLIATRVHYKQKNLEWSSEVEAKIRKKYIDEICEQIASD